MAQLMKSLGLDRLTVEERRQLAAELFESIEATDPANPPMTEAQIIDLRRRIDEFEQDPEEGISLEEFESRLRSKA